MNRLIPILLLLASCASGRGDSCTVDSDCTNGLVCDFDNVCALPSSLLSQSSDVGSSTGGSSYADAGNDSNSDAETGSDVTEVGNCEAPTEAFSTDVDPCKPVDKYDLSGIQLATDGHSFKELAELGNQVITKAITDGQLNIDAWIDGTLAPNCSFEIAWITEDADRNADCSPKFSDTFPLSIPAFANPETGLNYISLIYDAKFDPKSGKLSGYIIKSEFEEGLNPTFSNIVTMLIEDVDRDSDGKPDALSIIVDLEFTPQSKNSK